MKIVGVDYDSNRVDVVGLNLDDDQAQWFRRHLDLRRGETAFDRARNVTDVMPSRGSWKDEGVILVALEEPFGQQKGASPLFRVQGAILACLPRGLDVWQLPPHEWRKTIGLPGSGNRDRMKQLAREFAHAHGVDTTWPQDAIDAYCIAYAARTLLLKAADQEGAAA